MDSSLNRRSFVAAAASLLMGSVSPAPAREQQKREWEWILPIGLPGRVPGDGFYVRHGYATENTWFNPGSWHTGEDWYLLEGNTAGAQVYAVADGEIVYAGFDYPGPVVIVQHDDELFSMYGHLDDDLAVESGPVSRGQVLGTILDRTDGRAPSHLHFEIRRFLTSPPVNGPSPRYGFTCGPNCPPGPGYWPIDAPEHPSELGWMNPTHVIARRSRPDGESSAGLEVMVAEGASGTVPLWTSPEATEQIGELPLEVGARYPVLAIDAGPEDSTETSAQGYRLWYQIEVRERPAVVWVQAIETSTEETGSDGRPAALRFRMLPYVTV